MVLKVFMETLLSNRYLYEVFPNLRNIVFHLTDHLFDRPLWIFKTINDVVDICGKDIAYPFKNVWHNALLHRFRSASPTPFYPPQMLPTCSCKRW